MNKYLTLTVAGFVSIGVAFWGGMKYQQTKSPRVRIGGQWARGIAGQSRPNGQGGAVMGEVLEKDENSITVRLPDGSSKIVILSETTIFSRSARATKDEMRVGERVVVFGSYGSDGTVVAQNVQLDAVFGLRPSPVK